MPRKPSKKNLYFNNGTQEAIIEFQGAVEQPERERLYEKEILPAFDKLVENLIFIHKFQGLDKNFEILKNDCVTFLYEKIHKYNGSMGTKAFSYFNVVAKNWLINNSKIVAKKLRRDVSIDSPSLTASQRDNIELYQVIPAQDKILIDAVNKRALRALFEKIREECTNKNEELCITSIIYIYDNIDQIDLLNKRAIYLYIRELSGLNPKQLTIAMSSIKKKYRIFRHLDLLEGK